MKPVNVAERKKAFLNFLLLFIILITVVITTVFFSVQVPFKENEKLRKEMDVAENEKIFLQSFEIRMQQTMNLLDSVNRAGNVIRIENDINNNIKAMTAMVNDSISTKGICNKIIDNLTSLRVAKEQLRTVSNNSAELENKDLRIQQLDNDLKSCNKQVIDLIARLSGR